MCLSPFQICTKRRLLAMLFWSRPLHEWRTRLTASRRATWRWCMWGACWRTCSPPTSQHWRCLCRRVRVLGRMARRPVPRLAESWPLRQLLLKFPEEWCWWVSVVCVYACVVLCVICACVCGVFVCVCVCACGLECVLCACKHQCAHVWEKEQVVRNVQAQQESSGGVLAMAFKTPLHYIMELVLWGTCHAICKFPQMCNICERKRTAGPILCS